MDMVNTTPIIRFLAEPGLPLVRRFVAYWEDKRGDRPFPARGDIDPLDFPYALGSLLLVEVQPGGRYRYRVFGDRVAARHGFDLTGQVLNDLPQSEYRDFVLGLYDRVADGGGPVFACGRRFVGGRLQDYEVALLPLGSGRAVEMILVGIASLPDGAGAGTDGDAAG